MSENPFECNLDIKPLMDEIYEWISELDLAKKSRLTIPIRMRLENAGDLYQKPWVIQKIHKDMWNIYHTWKQSLDSKAVKNNETIPQTLTFFIDSRGYYGPGYITFQRNGNVWQTNEIGQGYTTTADGLPDWFRIEKHSPSERVDYWGDFQHGLHGGYTEKTYGTIFNIPAAFEMLVRTHENSGGCFSYKIIFRSEEDTVEFGRLLRQVGKKNEPAFSDIMKLVTIDNKSNLQPEWEVLIHFDPRFQTFDILNEAHPNDRMFFHKYIINEINNRAKKRIADNKLFAHKGPLTKEQHEQYYDLLRNQFLISIPEIAAEMESGGLLTAYQSERQANNKG